MEIGSRKTVHFGPGEGRAVRMPGAGLVTPKVSCERTGGAYSLFEVEVGPEGGEPPHVQHREDECLYVLDGEFEFLVDDDGGTARVGPGWVVYVPKGNLHRYRNTSEKTGRLLVIHMPGGSHERFVEVICAVFFYLSRRSQSRLPRGIGFGRGRSPPPSHRSRRAASCLDPARSAGDHGDFAGKIGVNGNAS